MDRTYTSDMREISGMGGGYEEGCRSMVLAGLRWFDEHPDADPKFHGFNGVYGLIMEDNKDAEDLSKAITSACDGCTGAMHQASVTHVLFIRKNGWEAYCEKMRQKNG